MKFTWFKLTIRGDALAPSDVVEVRPGMWETFVYKETWGGTAFQGWFVRDIDDPIHSHEIAGDIKYNVRRPIDLVEA